MAEIFKCPSCGAPLEYQGSAFQKCDFCGNTVIVPVQDLRASGGDALEAIKALVASGQMIHAIKLYRETFGVGLKEAKEAVEAIQQSGDFGGGGGAVFGGVSIADMTGMATKVAEIKRLVSQGQKIEAIKLFRETFGLGLKESKDAVEAIERGEPLMLNNFSMRTTTSTTSVPIDADTAKRVGAAVGGSILGSVVIIGLIIIGIIGAAFVVISRSVQKVAPPVLPTAASPEKQTVVSKPASILQEMLRFGGEGVGAGKFSDNRTVAVAPDGRIYSADYSGGRVQGFDADGKFLMQYAADPERSVDAVAADRKGNLFVLQGYDVFRFDRETGEQRAKFRVDNATDLVVGLDGRLYVSRQWDGIAVLNADGRQERIIKLSKDVGVQSYSALAIDGAGGIFLLDDRQSAIFKLAPDGTLVTRFGGRASGANRGAKQMFESMPQDLAVDSQGRLYAVETSRLLVFDASGNFLNEAEVRQGFGIAFDDKDQLYLASRPFVVRYKVSF